MTERISDINNFPQSRRRTEPKTKFMAFENKNEYLRRKILVKKYSSQYTEEIKKKILPTLAFMASLKKIIEEKQRNNKNKLIR